MPRFLVVGLGNPGPKYAATRHNVGFRVLDRLAERAEAAWRDDAELEARVASIELAGQPGRLIAPQTFMNRSGGSVAAACERWPTIDPEADLLVIYDDMDLPTGRLRIRPKGGGGGHRGISDILDALDTKAIARVRVGVGHPGEAGPAVIDWVLAPFTEAEQATLEASLDRAAEAVECVFAEGVPAAMGQYNSKK